METDAASASSSRRAFRVVGVLLVLLAAMIVRVTNEAASELALGRAAEDRGDTSVAMAHYRRAGGLYVPLSPYHGRALSNLLQLAESAELAEDTHQALAAYRAVRSAILSSRSLYTPEAERLTLANHHIAKLMARLPPPPMHAEESEQTRRSRYLARLSQVPGPHRGFALLAWVGFATWVSGAYFLFRRGLSDEGKFIPKLAARYGWMTVVGLASFGLGLWFA